MNTDYAATGLHFVLEKTTRVQNANWFNKVAKNTTEQTNMKKSLRKGGARTLNIYTVGFTSTPNNPLGYSTFPWYYASNPKNDGVVILYSSLPGGSEDGFNLGRTATHEVGHWAGLYHTYQGGCKGDGDFVSDTPPEASPARGCPTGRNTCSGSGPDRKSTFPSLILWGPVTHLPLFPAIHNYMDYADDSCMTNFTPGQITRLRAQLSLYRKTT